MQIVDQSWSLVYPHLGEIKVSFDWMISLIEQAGRICYKSEDKITGGSKYNFIRNIIDSGHESVVEHAGVSVSIITDRGVSHELVRHRLASYSQESTRYCRYVGDMQFIRPVDFDIWSKEAQAVWLEQMRLSELAYQDLLSLGQAPQNARSVLPNSLKTELVMTANMREWRHFFNLRCSKKAHPQMRALALDMLGWYAKNVPIIFDDIRDKYLI